MNLQNSSKNKKIPFSIIYHRKFIQFAMRIMAGVDSNFELKVDSNLINNNEIIYQIIKVES